MGGAVRLAGEGDLVRSGDSHSRIHAGIAAGGERASRLAADLRRRLDAIDGVRALERGANPCAIVTAEVRGWYSPDLVSALRARRINSAATLRWFGLLDLSERGVHSAIRLSPHYYNTEEEIDEVVGAIAELAASTGHHA